MTRKSPLPFQGQKKNFVNMFIDEFNNFKDFDYVVDLFGGSGLLSQISYEIKREREREREYQVIWNDFDNFKERLVNMSKTNKIISEIKEILKDQKLKTKIDDPIKIKRMKDIFENAEYLDVITLSSKYCFPLKFIKTKDDLLNEKTYFINSINEYKESDYLKNVTRVQKDFYDLFLEYKDKNTLFLIDPPYENTNNLQYNGEIDYKCLKDIFNYKFILFSSEKTNILNIIPENCNIK